jgi:hypothetical protein
MLSGHLSFIGNFHCWNVLNECGARGTTMAYWIGDYMDALMAEYGFGEE